MYWGCIGGIAGVLMHIGGVSFVLGNYISLPYYNVSLGNVRVSGDRGFISEMAFSGPCRPRYSPLRQLFLI